MMQSAPGGISVRTTTSESIKLATMVVTTFPIVCVYPFLQKYFVKGMLLGSVKG
jgi:putative aldouronate transport system permease protein